MSKCIVIVGNFMFPNGNASGKRILGSAKLFQQIGYKVICIGVGTHSSVMEYDYITSYTVKKSRNLTTICNEYKHILKLLETINRTEEVACLLLYGALFSQVDSIRYISWAKHNKIKVIYDHVDWFEPNLSHFFRSLVRLVNYQLLKFVIWPKCDGIICISTFLEEYHKKRGRKTVILPPLSIIKSSEYIKSDESIIRFIYSGTTADCSLAPEKWKDRLDIMFALLSKQVNKTSINEFTIDIFGMSENRYLLMYPKNQRCQASQILDILGDRVHFHGFTENEVIEKQIKESDFSILIRDKKKSNMAGFPTKVSESISLGIPVFCTDSSDLKDYISNGGNGIITELSNVEQEMNRLLSLSREDIETLKKNCCRNNPFWYGNFSGCIIDFLNNVGI